MSSVTGIYATIGGVLTKIADSNTPIPGTTENFTGFGNPVISGDIIAFQGERSFGPTSSVTGIYAAEPSSTAVPEPTSVLGLLAFSALGAGLGLRGKVKNQHYKAL
jgi:hypothetical protein